MTTASAPAPSSAASASALEASTHTRSASARRTGALQPVRGVPFTTVRSVTTPAAGERMGTEASGVPLAAIPSTWPWVRPRLSRRAPALSRSLPDMPRKSLWAAKSSGLRSQKRESPARTGVPTETRRSETVPEAFTTTSRWRRRSQPTGPASRTSRTSGRLSAATVRMPQASRRVWPMLTEPVASGTTGTRSMPQMGQRSGLADFTLGCIGQV